MSCGCGHVPILGHGHVARERRPAPLPQVDVHDHVRGDLPLRGDARGRLDLVAVPLPVAEGHGVHGEAVALGDGQHGGGIEAAAQQHHGGAWRGAVARERGAVR